MRRAAIFGALALAAAGAAALDNVIEGFQTTLQRHPNGKAKTILYAKTASMGAGDAILGTGLDVYMYDAEGNLEGVLECPDAVTVDKASRTGYGDGHVRLERGGMKASGKDGKTMSFTLEGDGFLWRSTTNEISIVVSEDDGEVLSLNRGNTNEIQVLTLVSNVVLSVWRDDGEGIVKGWK